MARRHIHVLRPMWHAQKGSKWAWFVRLGAQSEQVGLREQWVYMSVYWLEKGLLRFNINIMQVEGAKIFSCKRVYLSPILDEKISQLLHVIWVISVLNESLRSVVFYAKLLKKRENWEKRWIVEEKIRR